MSDSFTEVTSQSWFGRIGGAIKGILFGFILILAGIVLLFWNEGRAVTTHKALVESQNMVKSIDALEYQANYDGELVHLSGKASADNNVEDALFKVSVSALKLKRNVETYQWQEESRSETQKKLGGGSETVTTYTYEKGWHSGLISSSNFHHPAGHENPTTVAYQTERWTAANIRIGEYTLGRELKREIDNYETLDTSQAAASLSGVQRHGDQFYVGGTPASPQVGDQRIRFKHIPAQDYSVAARLAGYDLVAHTASNGHSIALLTPGVVTAQAMFEQAKADNETLTWILRLVGTVMLVIGFSLLMKLFSVVADILPLAGDLVEMGTGLIAIVLGLAIALLTISIAWITYRPILGISIIVCVIGLFWFLRQKKVQAHQRVLAKMPAPPSGQPSTTNSTPPPL